MHLVLRVNAKKNFFICVWWEDKEREREREREIERERYFSESRSQLLFVFLLDKFRAARRMSENTNDYSDDTVYLKVSYFKARGLYFFMKGLRWFMLWPRLFGKSPRALRCDLPGGNWQGTGVCREGNPGSKEGLRENEQTSIFASLVLVILVYLVPFFWKLPPTEARCSGKCYFHPKKGYMKWIGSIRISQ